MWSTTAQLAHVDRKTKFSTVGTIYMIVQFPVDRLRKQAQENFRCERPGLGIKSGIHPRCFPVLNTVVSELANRLINQR